MQGVSRGFSLLEVVIAVGIFTLLCVGSLRLISGSLHFAGIQAQRDADGDVVGQLVDRFRQDEDSAWAIFTPPNDVLGGANADGHEVDFFTRDGANRSYFWAYRYDAPTQTLTRYLYPQPGAPAVRDETFAGVTKFVAHAYPVTALQDSSTPAYSALYKDAVLQPGAVRFYPQSAPWIAGGNQITEVRLETTSQVREMQLATPTAPSGFTIVFRYTPAPAATTGPLTTLGKIVFEPGSMGGSTQPGTCSYAQLFMPDGSADANGKDGFNATDAQGCVTNSSVRLWAAESGYQGMFSATYPTSGGCASFLRLSAPTWSPGSAVSAAPTAPTSGCTVQVASSDRTIANGGGALLRAVVDSPPCLRGTTCYSVLAFSSWRYFEKCSGGGAQGPPCPTGGNWFYSNNYTLRQYSSIDGGATWSDLGSNYTCSTSDLSNGPGGLTCAPMFKVPSVAYDGTDSTGMNMQTGRAVGPTYTWSPSAPPATP